MQYRKSLQWMESLEGIVMPGHGKRISNIQQVAENHLRQQHQRYQQIMGMLRPKPHSLYELSQILFKDALQRGEHFLVFSEIIGYLDWGEREGIITKDETEDGIQLMMK